MGDNSDTPTSTCGGQAGYPSQTHTQTIQTQASITNITNVYNFSNVAQVIHVPGHHNVTNVPNTTILTHQQATGVNPTVGQAQPPPPSHSHPSATCCDPTTRTAATFSSGVSVSQGATAMGRHWNQGFGTMQQNVTFAEGPPEGTEVVELAQKLMAVLGENWTMLGSYLNIPDHELVAVEVEERTLYRRVSRLLKFWVDQSDENDRKQLVSVLSQVKPYNLGQCAYEVLRKAP